MKIRFPWLNTRKKLLLISAIEIFLIFFINFNLPEKNPFFIQGKLIFSIILLPFWFLFSYIMGRYSFYESIYKNKKLILLINLIFRTFIVSILSIFFVLIIQRNINLNNYNHYDQIFLIYSFLISVSINLVQLPLINFFIKKILNEEVWIFIGSKNIFEFLKHEIKWSRKKIKIIYKDINFDFRTLNQSSIEGIIFNSSSMHDNSFSINIFDYHKYDLKVISLEKWCEINLQRLPSKLINNDYLLSENFVYPNKSIQSRTKRIGDIFFSLFLLITTSPIIFISIVLIFLEDKKGFLYKQERVGLNQNIYTIYKLRTMKINAENGKPQWSSKSDPRITKVGRFLRKMRLDELPQLFNVIKGDMSLIGPRPERKIFDIKLEKSIEHYNLRYLVKPGLSGWAQVNYNYGSSIEDSKKKFSYDIYYLKNFSIWFDIFIMFKTIRLVFLGRGSSPNN